MKIAANLRVTKMSFFGVSVEFSKGHCALRTTNKTIFTFSVKALHLDIYKKCTI